MTLNFKQTWKTFATHYDERYKNGTGEQLDLQNIAGRPGYYYHHPALRPGNGPRILYHDAFTENVIVLTHGLTDSPHYLQEVADCFFEEGCNVVMPLLPAHGQIRRKKDLEDEQLSEHWQKTIDDSVEVAKMLGQRVSLGGFSTGGALSLNKVLRDKENINGGIFLFSGALSIGRLADKIGDFEFVERVVDLFFDRIDIGEESPDPYKYPHLPKECASELVEIIKENNHLLGEPFVCGGTEDHRLKHPVFAAHSLHDATATMEGVANFMRDYVASGLLFPVLDCVQHASLPLREAIQLDLNKISAQEKDPAKVEQRKKEWEMNTAANPQFDKMMAAAMAFFKKVVK